MRKVKNWDPHEIHSRIQRIVSLDQLGESITIQNIQSPNEDNLLSCERYKIITSKALGTMHAQNDRSTTVVVLILGAFMWSRLITKSVYTRVIHSHITVPTITGSLRYMNPRVKKWLSCGGQACHWCSYHTLTSPVFHYLRVISRHDICYREIFFNINSFWQVKKSF